MQRHSLLALALLLVGCTGNRPQPTKPGGSQTESVEIRHAPEASLETSISQRDVALALTLAAELELQGGKISTSSLASLVALVDSTPAQALPELPTSSLAFALVALRRALLKEHRGDRSGAQKELALARSHPRLQDRWNSVARRITRADVEVHAFHVAVLLPMSGPHAAVGKELWAGMSLALEQDPRAKVKLFDTQGTEAGAKASVAKAVAAGCIVAIGPAGRLESRAAARAAALAKLPIALLAPESQGANPDAGVFRLSLAPEFEAEQAAMVAVELGYRLLAVLSPRDELGQRQAQAFVAAAKAAGAEIVSVASYDPSGAGFEQDFKDFLKPYPQSNARLRKHLRHYGRKSWKSFLPAIDFDFLYMPDALDRGTLAASYLPFFNIELRTHDDMSIESLRYKHGGIMPRVVQLMGASTWLDPSLGARGGAAVEGALVIGSCPGGQGIELSVEGRRFHEQFQTQHGRAPSATAASAHDAMTIVLGAREWAASHGGRREDVSHSLRSALLRGGVCGTRSMNSEGQLVGEIEVMRVQQGTLEIFEY